MSLTTRLLSCREVRAPPWRTLVPLAAVGLLFLACATAQAVSTFSLSPGGNPAGDTAWQNAVGNVFIEFNLDNYANHAAIDTLTAGPVTIDVGLAGPGTAGAAQIFWGSYTGGQFGTVAGAALLNLPPSTSTYQYSQITFDFSEPVKGFGTWVYDNAVSSLDSFRLIVTEVGGATTTSAILEAGNGYGHAVEGFIGATSSVGITSVAVEALDAMTGQPHVVAFEIDHLQVALTPEPLTVAGLALGLGCLARYVRKRR
jgi:hypothetical protein